MVLRRLESLNTKAGIKANEEQQQQKDMYNLDISLEEEIFGFVED